MRRHSIKFLFFNCFENRETFGKSVFNTDNVSFFLVTFDRNIFLSDKYVYLTSYGRDARAQTRTGLHAKYALLPSDTKHDYNFHTLLLGLFFGPENEGEMFLRNDG
jgi:hypothetical protein